MIKTLKSFDLKNKKILIRVDYNVPLENEKVIDNYRIKASLPTIKTCLDSGASLILMSHLGRPKGLKNKNLSLIPIGEELASLLQMPIKFSDNCISQDSLDVSLGLKSGEIHLLENLRFHSSEQENDSIFSSILAKHGQIYINDAFGTTHRNHASNVGIVSHFKHFGIGLLMSKELKFLGDFKNVQKQPFVLIIGGAKIDSKLDLINRFLDNVSHILIGGGMAFTFLKAKGKEVGGSLVDNSMINMARLILTNAREKNVQILLPEDVLCSKSIDDDEVIGPLNIDEIPKELMGLDIGPKTVTKFKNVLSNSKTVLWNGPLGLFENDNFGIGSKEIAIHLSELYDQKTKVIIGGGDTAAVISKFKLHDKMTHVSTGGGSSLEYLSGKSLSAIQALEV